MNTYPFNPTPLQNVTFNPVLNGQTYTAVVTWSVFGQRWYLNLSDSNGNLIVSTALVSSQDPQALASISWKQNVVTAETVAPHWLPLGSQALLYLSGNAPDAYNGFVLADVSGPSEFTFALTTDPGQSTAVGVFGSVVDLSAGLVPGAMLLFFAGAMQFATTP